MAVPLRRAVWFAISLCAVVALLPASASASALLQGDHLQVGVSNSGGLIDDAFTAGVNLDPAGGGAYTAADFLRPGTPFEFYSIGVGGSSIGTAGYALGDPFAGVTADTSWGTQLTADTSARWDGLGIYQNAWFDTTESTIHFVVTLTNTRRPGSASFTDVAYARGAEPDQDLYTYGTYFTNNSIGSGGVTAVGPFSGWSMTLVDTWGGGNYPVSAPWETDPYLLQTAGNDGNGDYTINCAWDLGTIAPGTSKSVSFDYVFAAPGLPAFALVGAAPVLGALIRRRKP